MTTTLHDRWWISKLAAVEDPISLEPLRTLKYPPFQCKADPSLPHDALSSDWFDGHVFAMYLVSTAHFVHPISRRELTRAECVALDQYCVHHDLCGDHVVRVFDGAQAGEASVAQLQAEANGVLRALFGRQQARHGAELEFSSVHPTPGHSLAMQRSDDGGLVVFDDDALPTHAVGAASGGEAGASDAASEDFPILPVQAAPSDGHTASPGGSPPRQPTGSWADSGASAHLAVRRPPLVAATTVATVASLTTLSAEEQARRSRARLERERRAWAFASIVAEAKAAADAAAEAAAAAAAAERRRQTDREWAVAARLAELQARHAAKEAARVAMAERARQQEQAEAAAIAAAAARLEAARADEAAREAATAQQEVARQLAKERKRHSEKVRKERRRAEAVAQAEALRVASRGEDAASLEAAVGACEAAGSCDATELASARWRLAELHDPSYVRRREREARAGRIVQRLGGRLTEAQEKLVYGEDGADGAACGVADGAVEVLKIGAIGGVEASVMSQRTTDAAAVDLPGCDAGRGAGRGAGCGAGREAGGEAGGEAGRERERDAEAQTEAGAGPSAPALDALPVVLCYRGRSAPATVGRSESAGALFEAARRIFDLPSASYTLKLLSKGKALQAQRPATEALGAPGAAPPKLMVVASACNALDEVRSAVADPSIASFAAEHGSRKCGLPTSRGVPAVRSRGKR